MAAASLVATAVGIILIIVTAYVLAGGTLVASEVVSNAQKDMTALQVKMLGTSIEKINQSALGVYPLNMTVKNTGREPIRNFQYIDVYLYNSTSGWDLYDYSSGGGSGHWKNLTITDKDFTKEKIYPNQWDPGEILIMSVEYTGAYPDTVKIVTGNGIANS